MCFIIIVSKHPLVTPEVDMCPCCFFAVSLAPLAAMSTTGFTTNVKPVVLMAASLPPPWGTRGTLVESKESTPKPTNFTTSM